MWDWHRDVSGNDSIWWGKVQHFISLDNSMQFLKTQAHCRAGARVHLEARLALKSLGLTSLNHTKSTTPTVTDYTGHRQTLLPVREINLKACALVILNQIISGIQTQAQPVPTQVQHTLC